jgi:hypothetical protein
MEQSIEQQTSGDWQHGSMTDIPISRTLKRQVLDVIPPKDRFTAPVVETEEYKQQSASWTYGMAEGQDKSKQVVDSAGPNLTAL